MCLQPIKISKPALGSSPLRILRDTACTGQVRGKISAYHRNTFLIPCGKCVECLKRKQNDLAARCVREANRYGNMVFVTLTYSEQNVPIACATELIDKESGEVMPYEVPEVGRYEHIRNSLISLPRTSKPRYIVIDDEEYSDTLARRFVFTPSLNRADFRLYLKRQRVKYEREHGEKLPDFKYVCVGEYGPKTCRPHMHCIFVGLSLKTVRELFDDWRSEFGRNLDFKQVKFLNNDGTHGFQIASKYIAKYMVKGQKAECESVTLGYAQKPRMCISCDFGASFTEKELEYYLAFDMFGRYNPDDVSHLTEWQLSRLAEEVSNRMKVDVYGWKYPMPQIMKRRIYYKKRERFDREYKKVLRYEATQLQSYRLALLSGEFSDSVLGQLRTAGIEVSAEGFALAMASYRASLQVDRSLTRQAKETAFLNGYSKSIF